MSNAVRLSSTVSANDPTEGRRLEDFEFDSGFANPLADLFCARRTVDAKLRSDAVTRTSASRAIHWQGEEFHAFMACFTPTADELTLWRFYGDDGKGFCIVTPLSAFDGTSSRGFIRDPLGASINAEEKLILYRVRYEDCDVAETLERLREPIRLLIEVAEGVSREADFGSLLMDIGIAIVSDLLYLYKHSQYREEKELRAVEARSIGDSKVQAIEIGGVRHARLHIDTGSRFFASPRSMIIVGPKVPDRDAVKLDIQHRLERHGWGQTCTVTLSPHPYR